jgi:hypothetical protein
MPFLADHFIQLFDPLSDCRDIQTLTQMIAFFSSASEQPIEHAQLVVLTSNLPAQRGHFSVLVAQRLVLLCGHLCLSYLLSFMWLAWSCSGALPYAVRPMESYFCLRR